MTRMAHPRCGAVGRWIALVTAGLVVAVAGFGSFGVSPALASPSCSATGYPPSSCPLTLSASRVSPGGHVTAAASGYKAVSSVSLSLKCPASAATVLETVTTDSNGGFSSQLTIPSDTHPGRCSLTASGHSPTGAPRVLTAALTVVARQAPPPPPVSPAHKTLPFTGLDVIALAGLAALLIVGGVSLVVLTRRTRRGRQA